MSIIYKKIEEERFEFVLYVNNYILCQRYFKIFNFNEDSLKSLEMKGMLDNIMGMNNGNFGTLGIIPNMLRDKSIDNLWNSFKPYNEGRVEENPKNVFDKEDLFKFQFKVDKNVVSEAYFSGVYFDAGARFQINIRGVIPEIISEIRHYLAQRKYTKLDTFQDINKKVEESYLKLNINKKVEEFS